ncbi:hypothetical protein Halru_1343 [Halovivax ruber XH-70]|uniref:Uncharacterized protein n=1 Tax=Halovivax ruber (strain DSM 18193 / JCM 13892 / XH-70) TaxID=797302 RepID=L0ICK5_HALRX|nr:hypothetical protein [Halovivax ruber]AGB15956.1 hypothetical protein Halru_1343 [Halovivax ruber XH-70]
MTDEPETAAADESDTPDSTEPNTPRETAPMSEFGTETVTVGILVLVVGLAISFGVPLFVL